jgi:hypothetical protein
MASSSWRALDSKQIYEQLHDDSDSFTEFSQDIFYRAKGLGLIGLML